MPVSIVPSPTVPLNEPLRVLIYLRLDILRQFDESIAPWSPSDSGSSLMRKSGQATEYIANEVYRVLFGSAEGVPEIRRGTRGKDGINSDIMVYFDYQVKSGDNNPPILGLSIRDLVEGNLVLTSITIDEDEREEFNQKVAYSRSPKVDK